MFFKKDKNIEKGLEEKLNRDEEIEKELTEIYSKNGKMPDFKNFQIKHDRKIKTVLV